MKFTINCNQYAAQECGLKPGQVDIIDLAIFDCVKDMFSHFCEKLIYENETYYWVSYDKVIEQLPYAGLNTSDSVYRRIKKLCGLNIFKLHPRLKAQKKTFITYGTLAPKLIFSKPPQSITSDKNPRTSDKNPKSNDIHRMEIRSESGFKSDVTSDENPMDNNIHSDNSINDNFINKNINSDFLKSELGSTPIVEKVEVKTQKKLKEKNRAQILKEERDAKNRTHLHDDFVRILDDFQEKVKGQRIPPSLWKMEVAAAKNIREVFVDLTEKKIVNATDQNILDSIELFLDILSKNLTPFDIQNMKPRYLHSKLIDFITLVKNAHNGKAPVNKSKSSITPTEQQLVNKFFAGVS